MFAVVKTGGKQYRVVPEDILKIEKLAGEAGDFVELSEVLMVGEGADTTIGAPTVDGACVSAEIVSQGRTRKIIAFKKRRRQNSRRTIGHRQELTTIRIAEILTDGKKPSKKAAPKKAAAKKDDAKASKKADAKQEAEKADAPKKDEALKKEKKSAPLFKAPDGDADKLTDIKGIGPVAEKELKEEGITTFAQIAALTDDEIAKIDENMPFSADQITDWRAQAKEKIG